MRDRPEVCDLRGVVKGEEGGRHRGDRDGAAVAGVHCQGDGFGGRLRPDMDGDVEACGGGVEEHFSQALTLAAREQKAFARRARHHHAIQARVRVEVDQLAERSSVERLAARHERRQRGGEDPVQGAASARVSSPNVAASGGRRRCRR